MFTPVAQDQIGALTFGKQNTNQDDLGISLPDLGDVKMTHNHDKKAAKFRSVEWNGFASVQIISSVMRKKILTQNKMVKG